MPIADHTDDMVIPIMLIASQGGPYDDESFDAGLYIAGVLTAIRAMANIEAPQVTFDVPSHMRDQVELLAMDSGYTVRAGSREIHNDQWRMTWAKGNDDDLNHPERAAGYVLEPMTLARESCPSCGHYLDAINVKTAAGESIIELTGCTHCRTGIHAPRPATP